MSTMLRESNAPQEIIDLINNDPVFEIVYGNKRITRTKIYERLRKRSWRKQRASKDAWLTDAEHEAYLEGLRDGLNAVRKA